MWSAISFLALGAAAFVVKKTYPVVLKKYVDFCGWVYSLQPPMPSKTDKKIGVGSGSAGLKQTHVEAIRPMEAEISIKPKCDTCDDTGRAMTMVCYGGPPIEVMGDCPDCNPPKSSVKVASVPKAATDNYMDAEAGWHARVAKERQQIDAKDWAKIQKALQPVVPYVSQQDRVWAIDYQSLKDQQTVKPDHWQSLRTTVKVNDDPRMPSRHDFVHIWSQSVTLRILPPLDGQSVYRSAYQHYYPQAVKCIDANGGRTINGLSEKCPICQFYVQQRDRLQALCIGDLAKFERLFKSLERYRSQPRFYYNVLVKGEQKPKLLSAPLELHERLQGMTAANGVESVADGRYIHITRDDKEFQVRMDHDHSPLGTLGEVRLLLSEMRSLPLIVESWNKGEADLNRILQLGQVGWENTLSQEFRESVGFSAMWWTIDKCIRKNLGADWRCTQMSPDSFGIYPPDGGRLGKLVFTKSETGYTCVWHSWDDKEKGYRLRGTSVETFQTNQRSPNFEDRLRLYMFAFMHEKMGGIGSPGS
jgi:hypothetical protein